MSVITLGQIQRAWELPLPTIEFVVNDGGRAAAGYRGDAGDCAVRSVAITTRLPYQEVYDDLFTLAGKGHSPRNGIARDIFRRYVESAQIGGTWTPTMGIGTGCQVHLRAIELPRGRLVVSLSKHYAAVIDGVLHDTYDCSREGTRCVYGYWTF